MCSVTNVLREDIERDMKLLAEDLLAYKLIVTEE
jgi:hypothetical protein